MKIPTYLDHKEDRGNPALTSLIDVVFLMLIFFVCASIGHIRESLLATELAPGSIGSELVTKRVERPLGEVWVKLSRTDQGQTLYQTNDRAFDNRDALVRVLRELAGLAPEIPVILDIGSGVPWGDVIGVYDACRSAGFTSINWAADRSKVFPHRTNEETRVP